MKQISGKELCRSLERHGWTLQRINGSHHIYSTAGSVVRLSVPVHRNVPPKLGLLRHLPKAAGIQESDL